MSIDNVKKMFEKIQKDIELQKKYAAVMQAHQLESQKILSGMLADLGKNAGFVFSTEDLLAARKEFMDKMNMNNELSDADLLKAAGGSGEANKAIAGVMSALSLGIWCAYVSLDMEKTPGGCGRFMSTVNCPK